jgi:sporulation protein YlmC with PRC-barrel domain
VQTVASPEEDVRGRTVTTADGEDLGKVADLLIDAEEGKVRFLLVEHGGFLGLGEKKTFIPVDAIVRITDQQVCVGQSPHEVAGAPAYDPDLVEQSSYYDEVYAHYGITPFWGMDYVYPVSTFRR